MDGLWVDRYGEPGLVKDIDGPSLNNPPLK